MDEQSLIESVKRGNSHAFGILMNAYKDMAFSVALNLVKNYHDAQETTQEGFIKAYRSIHSFKGNSKFSSWLYRIIVNTAYTKMKKKKPVEQIENISEPESVDIFPTGFGKIQKEEQIKYLKEAINTLPEMDGLVISLFYLQEQSVKEVAEIADLSISNVKVKLNRARKKLYEYLSLTMKDEINSLL